MPAFIWIRVLVAHIGAFCVANYRALGKMGIVLAEVEAAMNRPVFLKATMGGEISLYLLSLRSSVVVRGLSARSKSFCANGKRFLSAE